MRVYQSKKIHSTEEGEGRVLTLPILADMSGGERVGGDEITETGGGRDYQALPHHTTPPLRMFVQFLLRILRNFFVFSLVFLLFFSSLSSFFFFFIYLSLDILMFLR